MEDEKSASVFIGYKANSSTVCIREGGLGTEQETSEFYTLSGPLASACHKALLSQFHIQPCSRFALHNATVGVRPHNDPWLSLFLSPANQILIATTGREVTDLCHFNVHCLPLAKQKKKFFSPVKTSIEKSERKTKFGLKRKTIPVYAMKVYRGSRGIDPLLTNLDGRW
jgi:hypothetical protein